LTRAAIRLAEPGDVPALYDICLRTGAAGEDATGLMEDPELLGDLFVVPYAVLEPQHAFVVADGTRAQGYCVGALDTRAFEARLEAEWWPAVRGRRADPATATGLDGLFLGYLATPITAHPRVVERYPSHLHIDLLPSYQSGGWGRRLLDALFDALRSGGSTGVHLGVAEANVRAIGFYRHLGFDELHTDGFTKTMALAL
jgi:ribosomal protein S18 acetylase RimI-like enzyme